MAERAGEFRWNPSAPGTAGRGGWVWPVDPLAWPPWKRDARYQRFHWTFCPFCGVPLPPLQAPLSPPPGAPPPSEGGEYGGRCDAD